MGRTARAPGPMRGEDAHWLALALDAASMGLWDWNPETGEVTWSPGVEALFGIPPGAFGGSFDGYVALLHPDDRQRVLGLIEQAMSSGEDYRVEHRILANGTLRWLSCAGRVRRDERGRVTGMSGAVVDVTAQREAEAAEARMLERLRRAEKSEAVGRLAAGVAHDLNNLLTVISSAAAMLAGAPGDRQALADVEDATRRASALTQQLLTLGRGQPLTLEPLALDEIVHSMTGVLRRLLGHTIQVEVELGAPGEIVRADRERVEQVLLNLVVNARDAMLDGGLLRIVTATRGDEVVLEVGDNGAGIPEEIRARIFEPFFTTKGGAGSGLGLSTVEAIVALLGGRIEVESEPGEGSTFRVLLARASD